LPCPGQWRLLLSPCCANQFTPRGALLAPGALVASWFDMALCVLCFCAQIHATMSSYIQYDYYRYVRVV
jgi:hypothetical protein